MNHDGCYWPSVGLSSARSLPTGVEENNDRGLTERALLVEVSP